MTAPESEQTPAPELPRPTPPDVSPVSRMQRREIAARDALRTLIRDFYLYRFGAQLPERAEFPLTLSLAVRPAQAWAVDFAPAFADQLQLQLEDLQAGVEVYRRGHVYCFRCRSSACEHSRPPDALSVFRAYTSTGVPEWCEMAQTLIEARHERVDQLYAEPPAVVAMLRLGHELRAGQLSSFGRASKTYAILGQVVAGYFLRPARGAAHSASDRRFAVTLQAVETRGADARMQLKLNPLVGGMDMDDWDELLASERNPSLDRAVARVSTAFEAIEQQVREARAAGDAEQAREPLRRLPQELRRLARTLEQGDRQQARRTRHVEDRRRQQRPVHKAIDDARAASTDDLFYDERRGTIVARGRQNRAHVFNAEGRHVTSFVIPSGAAELRLRTGRWRRLQEEEVASFRARLAPVTSTSGDA